MGGTIKARDTYWQGEVISVQRMFENAINSALEIPAHFHINFKKYNAIFGTK
ncbi:hypothetical protein LZ636_15350 [Proteus terrae]|uniref:hypothetical protein n=1 Tax=Proteus terrae TaxID=1574161 RepID=UPI001F33C11B|nr:hypothetical protein [Proteus terrae]MCE9841053.1 hypothetical protein [Proteus terrae]